MGGEDEVDLFCAADQRRLWWWCGTELQRQVVGQYKGKQGNQNKKPGDVKKPIVMQMVPGRAR